VERHSVAPKLKLDFVFGFDDYGGDLKAGAWLIAPNLSSHDWHLAGFDLLYRYNTPTVRQRLAHMWRFRSLSRRIGWVHCSLLLHGIESGCPVRLGTRQSHSVFVPETVVEKLLADAVDRILMASLCRMSCGTTSTPRDKASLRAAP
jgi:hypothetical protein